MIASSRATRIHPLALDRGRRLRKKLADVPGLELERGHRGVYRRGDVAVDVRVEQADRIALRVPLPRAAAPPSPIDALVTTGGLAGNLRFARDPRAEHGWALVADTQLNGVVHLTGTLAEVAADAGRVLAGPVREGDTAAPADPARGDEARIDAACDARLEEAIGALGWPDDAIVRAEAGWELRPRFQRRREAAVVPVHVAPGRGGLRVHRTLLARRPDAPAAPHGPVGPEGPAGDDPRAMALAELALRLNACVRLARLALDGPALVVETHLRDELVTATWLREAARAVAAASAFCRPSVALLAREHGVAGVFLAASVACPAIPTPTRGTR